MSHHIVIDANTQHYEYWKDLWRYRGLFYFLAWRDILVRYKQTVIGILWAVLRPFLCMVVFTIIFHKFAHLPSEGVPYAILVYVAMLPWQFFSSAFSEAANSLINNSNLLTKVYFPRLIIPTSSVIVTMIDFLIAFSILLGLMGWYQFLPSYRIIFLPFLIFWTFLLSMGAGLYIAALNVKYRDFRYVLPFVVQFGLYISPVGFSSTIVPEKWRLLYSLNPMVGIIDGFRWAVIPSSPIYLPSMIASFLLTIGLFFFGLSYFRRQEEEFADII